MLCGLVTLCAPAGLQAAGSGPPPAKDVAVSYLEQVWGAEQTAAIGRLVAADFRGTTVAEGQRVFEGHAGLRAWLSGLDAAFAERLRVVKRVIVDGGAVVAVIQFTGKHRETGRIVSVEQVFWLRVERGKIVEQRVYFDVGGVLARLSA
jgi:ketosteroid isomerase-like protein